MIPVPGASFVYSLLKDIWSWGLPWFRGRRFQPWGWTVGRWYHPYDATEKFGDQDRLRYYKEAQLGMEKAFFECCKDAKSDEKYKQYKDAKLQVEGFDDLIREDLNELLARGELIARGFREPFSHGAPYLTISRHEWLIIELVPLDRAEGGGVSYIGLRIGKAGTRSVSRRLKQ
jgi:hypothetical protein